MLPKPRAKTAAPCSACSANIPLYALHFRPPASATGATTRVPVGDLSLLTSAAMASRCGNSVAVDLTLRHSSTCGRFVALVACGNPAALFANSAANKRLRFGTPPAMLPLALALAAKRHNAIHGGTYGGEGHSTRRAALVAACQL